MMIIHGDCLEELKKLPANSVDAVITDPPYGIGFMGKGWDKYDPTVNKGSFKVGTGSHPRGYVAINKIAFYDFCLQWATECLRVLKPGGHLLSFGGTRTYHRMACAIEDAGFEIRDMIEWIYGSGFPKSMNIGKAVDKIEGNNREVVGENPNHRESDALYKLGFQG
ncbi:MAG: site-specific DNA-methyltransferase, partial [Proteobacteria bacterium]|nr:site-specific DNA-methyltransferase [Pseudomonadota bacterium]